MRRTRKWSFVAQEANRLAELGLSGNAIAKKLDVNQSSVSRWIKAGKLVLRHGDGNAKHARRREVIAQSGGHQTAEQWAAAVREAYALDVTDEQLVTSAESALLLSRDPGAPAQIRLQAMGRFQALVKQLALVARNPPAEKAEDTPKRAVNPVVRRSGGDPRALLTAVK